MTGDEEENSKESVRDVFGEDELEGGYVSGEWDGEESGEIPG